MSGGRSVLACAAALALGAVALAWSRVPLPTGTNPPAGCESCHPARRPAWHTPASQSPDRDPDARRAHRDLARRYRGSCGSCHTGRFQLQCARCHQPGVVEPSPDGEGAACPR